MHFPRPTYASVVATLALVIATSGTAYAVTTINTANIVDQAVTTAKLHDGGVTNVKIATDAVGTAKVKDNSLSLADIRGADISGSISFSLGANSCGTLNMSVGGAEVGQVPLLSWTGTVPTSIVFGPMKVTATNSVSVRACNVSASSVSLSDIGVRIITFG